MAESSVVRYWERCVRSRFCIPGCSAQVAVSLKGRFGFPGAQLQAFQWQRSGDPALNGSIENRPGFDPLARPVSDQNDMGLQRPVGVLAADDADGAVSQLNAGAGWIYAYRMNEFRHQRMIEFLASQGIEEAQGAMS